MSNLIPFPVKNRAEDEYLLKMLGFASGMLRQYLPEIMLGLTLALYDEDRAAFDKAADQLFASRDLIVSRVSGSHYAHLNEAKELGNDYPHTLRPPKGYVWTYPDE